MAKPRRRKRKSKRKGPVDDWRSTFGRALADPVDQWLNAMVADISREIGGADPQERKRLRELVRQVAAMSSALEFLGRIQDISTVISSVSSCHKWGSSILAAASILCHLITQIERSESAESSKAARSKSTNPGSAKTCPANCPPSKFVSFTQLGILRIDVCDFDFGRA